MTGRSRARRNAARNRAYAHDIALMAVTADRAAAQMAQVKLALDDLLAATRRLKETR